MCQIIVAIGREETMGRGESRALSRLGGEIDRAKTDVRCRGKGEGPAKVGHADAAGGRVGVVEPDQPVGIDVDPAVTGPFGGGRKKDRVRAEEVRRQSETSRPHRRAGAVGENAGAGAAEAGDVKLAGHLPLAAALNVFDYAVDCVRHVGNVPLRTDVKSGDVEEGSGGGDGQFHGGCGGGRHRGRRAVGIGKIIEAAREGVAAIGACNAGVKGVVDELDLAGAGNSAQTNNSWPRVEKEGAEFVAAAPKIICAVADHAPGVGFVAVEAVPFVAAIGQTCRAGRLDDTDTAFVGQSGRRAGGREDIAAVAGEGQEAVVGGTGQAALGAGVAIHPEGVGAFARKRDGKGGPGLTGGRGIKLVNEDRGLPGAQIGGAAFGSTIADAQDHELTGLKSSRLPGNLAGKSPRQRDGCKKACSRAEPSRLQFNARECHEWRML